MDRNFCVRRFLLAIAERGGYFICRHHPQMPYMELGPLKKGGQSQTGEIYEQWIHVENGDGTVSRWRRLLVKLKKKTRDGESQISILTNLPKGKPARRSLRTSIVNSGAGL